MKKQYFYYLLPILMLGMVNQATAAGKVPPAPVVKGNGKNLSLANTDVLEGKKIADIQILGIKEEKELQNALLFLTLVKSKGETITQPDYVKYLIESGRGEIERSQQPFGFYHAQVDVDVQQKGQEVNVIYTVKQNKPTRFSSVNVQITGEALQDPEFQKLLRENPFKEGDILRHNQYEVYKAKFLALATARGYLDAAFPKHVIEVDPKTHNASLNLIFASGKRYDFGEVTFNKTPLDPDLLQRFVQFKPGEPYLSADVATLQQDLQGSGYFQQVLVGGEADKEGKTVPVNAQLTMAKNKHYVFGVGYSTDTGYHGKFDFDRRWVNSRGHQLSTKVFASQKNSSLDALYRIPAQNPTTDYYYLRLGGNIAGDAYDSRRAFLEGGYNFRLGNWEHRYAAVAAWEKFTIGNDKDSVWLVYPRGQWTYTSTENRLNPETGYQVRAEALGASKAVLSDVSAVQGRVDGRYLYSINEQNRIVGRGSLGATWTDDFHRLPPSLRFFAGGDKSIRGYAFNSIGTREDGHNIGGKYLAVGSLEYEYYFRPDWAAAVFVDAGDAWVDNYETMVGAGAGVHWRSPVGPIKVDIGHGFNKEYGDKYRLHMSIGAELDL